MRFLVVALSLLISDAALGQSADTMSSHVGLHLLSTNWPNQNYTFISPNPNEREIEQLMERLDWVEGFHQVVLTTSKNTSMEVGGSMHPNHGLSAVYRVLDKKIYSVTSTPPINVGQMKQILKLFLNDDKSWQEIYGFKTYL